MIIIAGYIIFGIICFLYALYALKNAPTDVELWGKEVE